MGRGVGGPGWERCPGLGSGRSSAGSARGSWDPEADLGGADTQGVEVAVVSRWGWETRGGTRGSEWKEVEGSEGVGEGGKGSRRGRPRLAGAVREEIGC